jgi:hypothetical protein
MVCTGHFFWFKLRVPNEKHFSKVLPFLRFFVGWRKPVFEALGIQSWTVLDVSKGEGVPRDTIRLVLAAVSGHFIAWVHYKGPDYKTRQILDGWLPGPQVAQHGPWVIRDGGTVSIYLLLP